MINRIILLVGLGITFCQFDAWAQTPYGSTERRPVYKYVHTKYGWENIETKKTYPAWWDDCAFTNSFTLKQRLHNYPFNKAAKIVAISYRGATPDPNADIEYEGQPIPPPYETDYKGLFIKNGRLDICDVFETKELNQTQINRLTRIIYNTDYKRKKNFEIASPGCTCIYVSEVAILFYDKHRKIYDYLDIDFKLEEYRSKSERINLGTSCNQKFDLARAWFKDVGIHYGIGYYKP